MARPELQKLYQQLTTSGFHFVQRGELDLEKVYEAVKAQFPELCDDSFLCRENCTRGPERPEWQHVVRRALQNLKAPEGSVRHGTRHAHWEFV